MRKFRFYSAEQRLPGKEPEDVIGTIVLSPAAAAAEIMAG